MRKVFGIPVPFLKDYAVSSANYGSMLGYLGGIVREAFAGAWQRNIYTAEPRQNLLAFSAIYACVALIAGDISKLSPRLMQRKGTFPGYFVETENSSFSPVLRKPNRYQTIVQFLSEWVTSVMLNGNAYIYLETDQRNVVNAMYVLNPNAVTVYVADDGTVFYELKRDNLAGIQESDSGIKVPSEYMIHDRAVTLFHPLVGVSPIFAGAMSATQGIRIQRNSAVAFQNMSRPSGILTSANRIDDETAKRLKADFEEKTGDYNLGRIIVGGNGLKFEPMNALQAADAQLIEQLRFTVEDVCRCFLVPLYKIAGSAQPTHANITQLNQDYFSQCLQQRVKAMQELIDIGLGIGRSGALPGAQRDLNVWFDLDELLLMDPATKTTVIKDGISSGALTPNEGRDRLNLPPIAGGDTAYMQQQMWPLSQLAARRGAPPMDALPSAPAPALPKPEQEPAAEPSLPPAKDMQAAYERFVEVLTRDLDLEHADADA